jgi:hypothetical protein
VTKNSDNKTKLSKLKIFHSHMHLQFSRCGEVLSQSHIIGNVEFIVGNVECLKPAIHFLKICLLKANGKKVRQK